MVLLDSAGKYSRIADAERIRKWIVANHTVTSSTSTSSATTPATQKVAAEG